MIAATAGAVATIAATEAAAIATAAAAVTATQHQPLPQHHQQPPQPLYNNSSCNNTSRRRNTTTTINSGHNSASAVAVATAPAGSSQPNKKYQPRVHLYMQSTIQHRPRAMPFRGPSMRPPPPGLHRRTAARKNRIRTGSCFQEETGSSLSSICKKVRLTRGVLRRGCSSLALHTTRPTPTSCFASRWVQAINVRPWLMKTRRAPSRHCIYIYRDARVYCHTTNVMHDMSVPRPPAAGEGGGRPLPPPDTPPRPNISHPAVVHGSGREDVIMVTSSAVSTQGEDNCNSTSITLTVFDCTSRQLAKK